MNVEEIKAILKEKDLEEVLSAFDWKAFEDFVSEIFVENGFKVERNIRFKIGRRYEIDLLAIRSNIALCVDCKQWSRGRYKISGLKSATLRQEERLKQLKKVRKDLKSFKCFSVIITLFEEGIVKEHETLVVPVWKLNNFLCNLEEYL